jgi:aminoglycoside phosphotransferase (APT) family kinase protein
VDVAGRLSAFVGARLGPTARVEHIERPSTGRSRENWLFDAVWIENGQTVRERLIARRDPLGGLIETSRSTEFELLRCLERAPIPTPRAQWLDATGDELGRPSLVMTRLDGTCDYYALNGNESLPVRVDLARRLCHLLADVHAVDWRGLGLGEHLSDPGPTAAETALREWSGIRERDQLEPYPELVLAEQWLARHAPNNAATVLVHADFKVGNVLLDKSGTITALLDWELAHLGDRHEDLGWVTQPLRTKEHRIRDAWEADDLLRAYEQHSGVTIDRDAVRWWQAFSTYKTAIMQISGLRAFVEKRSGEHYHPTARVISTLLQFTFADTDEPLPDTVGSFLDTDTRATYELLGEMEPPTPPNLDDRARNVAARRRLADHIHALGGGVADDVQRRRIAIYLATRSALDPAFARKPPVVPT